MKYFIITLTFISLFSCKKHEKKLEGSWFVNYFKNDLKTNDFTLLLNEGGTGKIDGVTDVSWGVNKKDLTLIIDDYSQDWENNRNKNNEQYYISSDSLGNYLRMEMERIK